MTFQSGGTLDGLPIMSRRKRQQEGGYVFVFVLNICGPDLVDVVQFEVFQKQQQDGRDGLHDDLLVSIDVDAQFHALEHGGPASVNQNHRDFILMPLSFTFSFYLTILIHLKMQHIPVFSPFITSIKMFQRHNIVPVLNAAAHWRWTYGISSGSTSARMLIESVLALEVGAAASRIFSRAI